VLVEHGLLREHARELTRSALDPEMARS